MTETIDSILGAINPAAVTKLIRDAVEAEILPRFRNLSEGQIQTKSGPMDMVTEADIEAERALTKSLQSYLPGSVVVGEEAVFADGSIIQRLAGAHPVWIIDPVDGTGNFTRGDVRFGCIVALAYQGQTIAGWIDDCVADRTTHAVLGQGCWEGGQRCLPAPDGPTDLGACSGYAGGQPVKKALTPHMKQVERVTSAAHVYLSLIRGSAQIGGFTRLNSWDHAAGLLMIKEWGGVARMLDGSDYAPVMTTGAVLSASSEALWQAAASPLSKLPSLPEVTRMTAAQ
ncbi:MAG: inositol monophosphatase family protein [Rhodospirillaceae bacterium]